MGLSRAIHFSHKVIYSISPIFRDQVVPGDGIVKLPRNVGNEFPAYAASRPRKVKALSRIIDVHA